MLDREVGSSLLAAAGGGAEGLERAEVVSNAAVMLFGGIETTEGMIANAAWHLLSNRDELALVTADRRRLPNAIEESLRLEPAAAMVDRYATADVSWATPRSAGASSSASLSRRPTATPRPSPIPTASMCA